MQVSIDPVRPAWIKSSSDGSATAYREHINQRPILATENVVFLPVGLLVMSIRPIPACREYAGLCSTLY